MAQSTECLQERIDLLEFVCGRLIGLLETSLPRGSPLFPLIQDLKNSIDTEDEMISFRESSRGEE